MIWENYRREQMARHAAEELDCDMCTVSPNTVLEITSVALGLASRKVLSEYSRLRKLDLNGRKYGRLEP